MVWTWKKCSISPWRSILCSLYRVIAHRQFIVFLSMFSCQLFLSVFVAVPWTVFTFFLNVIQIQYFSWDSPKVTQIKRLTSVLQSVSVYTFQYDVCLFHNRSLIRSYSLVLHTASLVCHDLLILVFLALQGPPSLKSLWNSKGKFSSPSSM